MLFTLAHGLLFGSVLANNQLANAPNQLALSLPTGQWTYNRACGYESAIRELRYDRSRGSATALQSCAEDCEEDGNCQYAVFYTQQCFTGCPYRCWLMTAECGANVEEVSFTRQIYVRKSDEERETAAEAARTAEEERCIRRTGQPDCVPTVCEDIGARSVCKANKNTLMCKWKSKTAKCYTKSSEEKEAALTAEEERCIRRTGQPDCVPTSCEDIGSKTVCKANKITLMCKWKARTGKCRTAKARSTTTEPTTPLPVSECSYVVTWHVEDHAVGQKFATLEEAQNKFEELDRGLWATRLYTPEGEKLMQYGSMALKLWAQLDEWRESYACSASAPEPPTTAAPTTPRPITVERNQLALELSANQWTSGMICGTGTIEVLSYGRSLGLVYAKSECVRECERRSECRYLTIKPTTFSYRWPPYHCIMRTDECGTDVQENSLYEIYFRN